MKAESDQAFTIFIPFCGESVKKQKQTEGAFFSTLNVSFSLWSKVTNAKRRYRYISVEKTLRICYGERGRVHEEEGGGGLVYG